MGDSQLFNFFKSKKYDLIRSILDSPDKISVNKYIFTPEVMLELSRLKSSKNSKNISFYNEIPEDIRNLLNTRLREIRNERNPMVKNLRNHIESDDKDYVKPIMGYIIVGHGGEGEGYVKVPKGCIVAVRTRGGELAYGLLQYWKDMLENEIFKKVGN
jgi:hypothetical protein